MMGSRVKALTWKLRVGSVDALPRHLRHPPYFKLSGGPHPIPKIPRAGRLFPKALNMRTKGVRLVCLEQLRVIMNNFFGRTVKLCCLVELDS